MKSSINKSTLLRIGCANLAVVAFILVPAGQVSSVQSEPQNAAEVPIPHPAEVALLDEIAAWMAPEESQGREFPSFDLATLPHTTREVRRALVGEMPFGEEILRAASHNEVDALLVSAIVEMESGFDPSAVSPAGALGLMQVMPTTSGPGVFTNLTDPEENLDAGTRYLGELLTRFDGDLTLVLAAYNAGPANVRRYGGVPPFRETRNYVDRVTRRYLQHLRSAWRHDGRDLPAELLASL
jgi:soluble lytic murein transglycosylase-like protein